MWLEWRSSSGVYLPLDSISEAIKNIMEKLGIEHLKDKQREAITTFFSLKGRMSLFPSQLAMENHSSMHYCHTAICLRYDKNPRFFTSKTM